MRFTGNMIDGVPATARVEQGDVNDARPRVVAALLAAGPGERFESTTHKLLAELPATADRPAEPVATRSLSRLVEAANNVDGRRVLEAVIVITGAADLDELLRGFAPSATAAIAVSDATSDVTVVHNERWAEGQATSVIRAIQAGDELGADIVVIGLADQPNIAADTWRTIAAAAAEPSAAPVTVATYDGKPRNPVALHRSVWPLLPTEGDSGARDLVRFRPDLVRPVPSHGSPADIDTVEDLSRWLSS